MHWFPEPAYADSGIDRAEAGRSAAMQARQHANRATDRNLSTLDILVRLDDLERQLQEALALAQKGCLGCQQALAAVTVLRARVSNGAPESGVLRETDRQRSGDGRAVWLVDADEPVAYPSEQLTAREIEVLVLIADGYSNKEIARHLRLSVRTVERHINNIYRKIDAQNRADATAYALRHQLA